MKRSIFTIGLLAVLGCGGAENESTEPGASAAESTPGALEAEEETPRVARFALMPASAIQRGSIAPAEWGGTKGETRSGTSRDEYGVFDPDQLRLVEELRRQQKFPGGVQ